MKTLRTNAPDMWYRVWHTSQVGKKSCKLHCLHMTEIFLNKSLNAIYCTLITKKAHKTYRHFLKGDNVSLLSSYMGEEIGVSGGNY